MTGSENIPPAADRIRLDKWLWQARFLKSRSLAAKLCKSGRVRVNGEPTDKAHQAVRPGDVLTFPLGPHVRIARILAIGSRRGPAVEARTLYEDLSAPPSRAPGAAKPEGAAIRDRGAGRTTKSARRAIDRFTGRTADS